MRVSLSNMPAAAKTYSQAFRNLTGGLNLRDLHINLKSNESPAMRNLWWEDGVLQSRDGQVWLGEETDLGTGYTCYGELFWDHAFFHIGDKLFYMDVNSDSYAMNVLTDGVPENRGTFFRYQDDLFYKNKGGFYRVAYNAKPNEAPFKIFNVVDEAYVPVILINTDPEFCAGDSYQPENRLTGKKTVRYNTKENRTAYKLPVAEIDEVVSVHIDGLLQIEGEDYEVGQTGLNLGMVYFKEAPPVTDPPTTNTVEITYRKDNPDAYNAIMDCEYAMMSGGDQNLCILLAGCDAQPNAVYWNDRDTYSMNPGYFPITYYNLVGDTEDEVVGFGKQYSDTVVLKKRSIGRLDYGVQNVDDRDSISFTYTGINARIGCDLPWSIQTVENNIIFANTARGVHMIRSSSAAYENNVDCISDKVNGSTIPGLETHHIRGLLHDLRQGGTVVSVDDDQRYWLCVNGHVWLWDYSLSSYTDPSWFYLEGINAESFFRDRERKLYHLNAAGRVTRFDRTFSDYGAAIEKNYQFPVMNFGSYERLKDITSLLLAVRSDTESQVQIQYDSDYATRIDRTDQDRRTDLTAVNTWQWVWKNTNLEQTIVGYYNLEASRYAKVVRRAPGCRNVRHFALMVSNAEPGQDLAVVSAEIFYRFKGKER